MRQFQVTVEVVKQEAYNYWQEKDSYKKTLEELSSIREVAERYLSQQTEIEDNLDRLQKEK